MSGATISQQEQIKKLRALLPHCSPKMQAEVLKKLRREQAKRATTPPKEYQEQIERCKADPVYFTDRFGQIDDAQGHGDGSGTMPFNLWPSQADVMRELKANRLVLLLKARQLGISWLCCSYALWLCLFHSGKVVLLFSKGETEANELIRRIQALYDRLPEWLRITLPGITKDNTQVIEWGNGSRIQSFASSKGGGRSFTASLVIMDEAAFIMWADEIYTALKPTIDGGGQLIVLSTANGLGNLFHLLWTRAVAGLNRFKTIFLPWWSRPGRDEEWYAAQVTEYTDPAKVKQEYPATATEAFIASSRARFDNEWIEAQAANVVEPIVPRTLPDALRALPGLRVYKLPEAGRKYALAADVAEGLVHGDYSAAVLIDAETWEEIASLHGHWEPDVYAGYLMVLAEFYSAVLGVERNNHGHAVLATLKIKNAKNVYEGFDKKRGWLTNLQTKPLSIDALAEGLRDGLVKVRTQAALDEMQIYRILDDGKTGAPDGYNDDWVMAWAIVLMMTRHTKPRVRMLKW